MAIFRIWELSKYLGTKLHFCLGSLIKDEVELQIQIYMKISSEQQGNTESEKLSLTLRRNHISNSQNLLCAGEHLWGGEHQCHVWMLPGVRY